MKLFVTLASRFKYSLRIGLVTAMILSSGFMPAKAAKTLINWLIVNGTNDDQIKGAQALVDQFNASQDEITVQIVFGCIGLKVTNVRWVPDAPNPIAPLSEGKVRCQVPAPIWPLIANGSLQVDIVGPVGFNSLERFPHKWVDLQPLIKSEQFNVSQYPKSVLALFHDLDGQIALPFAVYPTVLFYNRDLFDEAGLAYPPAKFGEKYTLYGKQVEWNWDTLRLIAKLLTVDGNGNDATNAHFDPTTIMQYGYDETWSILRNQFASYGDSQNVDAERGTVQIPQSWRDKAHWLWNALWKDHFMPTDTAINSDFLRPSSFASGHVAMAYIPTWYTCCLGDLKVGWDIGVVPSYHGKYYAPTDADGFSILSTSTNPQAAFKVLKFLLGEAAPALTKIHGSQPSRLDLWKTASAILSQKYPGVKRFSLIRASLDRAISPYGNAYFTAMDKVDNRFRDFRNKLFGEDGSAFDVDQELETLRLDLQLLKDTPPKK